MHTITRKFEISNEDIDNLMVCALEGGINDWCCKAEMKKDPAGIGYDGVTLEDDEEVLYASDIISKGGTLILHDCESEDKWELNLENFLKGVEKEMENSSFGTIEELMDGHDAYTADNIIQCAIFGELTFC